MKIHITICLAVTLIGCGGRNQTGFTGKYTTSFKNEFSRARDTLLITEFDAGRNTFQLERRSTYQRIRQGKLMPPEHKKESWIATYDKNKLVLSEGELGRQVYLRPGFQSLSCGADYLRIK